MNQSAPHGAGRPSREPHSRLEKVYLDVWRRHFANRASLHEIFGLPKGKHINMDHMNVAANFIVFMGTERGVEFTKLAPKIRSSMLSSQEDYLAAWAVSNLRYEQDGKVSHYKAMFSQDLDLHDASVEDIPLDVILPRISDEEVSQIHSMVCWWATEDASHIREIGLHATTIERLENMITPPKSAQVG